jgi:hypothetical protein
MQSSKNALINVSFSLLRLRSVDTYQSHEGVLYCKPHFKTLFAPKVVEENNEPVRPRKLEMIILENQPIELPPDVVRVSFSIY